MNLVMDDVVEEFEGKSSCFRVVEQDLGTAVARGGRAGISMWRGKRVVR